MAVDSLRSNPFAPALGVRFALLFVMLAGMFFLIPLTDVNAPKWLILRIGVPAVFGVWIVRRAWNGTLRFRPGPLGWFALAFLATHCVSLVNAINPGLALNEISEFVALLALFFVVSHEFADDPGRDQLMWTLTLAGAATSLYGIAQHHGYDFFPWSENTEVPVIRGVSFFGHATFAASVLVYAIPLAVGLAATPRHWAGRLLALVALGLMLYHLSFSGARMATLAFLGSVFVSGIAAAAIWLRKDGGARLNWRVLSGGSLAFLVVVLAGAWFVHRAWEVKGSDLFAIRQASFAIRLFGWESAARMVYAHPATGVGAGNFETAAPAYWNEVEQIRATRYNRWMHEAHNEYLEIAVEQGVPGIAVFLALLAYGAVLALHLAAHGPTPTVRRTGLALFAALAAGSLDATTMYSLQLPGSAVAFWTTLGLIAVQYRQAFGGPTTVPRSRRGTP